MFIVTSGCVRRNRDRSGIPILNFDCILDRSSYDSETRVNLDKKYVFWFKRAWTLHICRNCSYAFVHPNIRPSSSDYTAAPGYSYSNCSCSPYHPSCACHKAHSQPHSIPPQLRSTARSKPGSAASLSVRILPSVQSQLSPVSAALCGQARREMPLAPLIVRRRGSGDLSGLFLLQIGGGRLVGVLGGRRGRLGRGTASPISISLRRLKSMSKGSLDTTRTAI